MSTHWTPTKPRSLTWSHAARIDGYGVLISNGFVMVQLNDMRSPHDTKHVARVIGDGPTQQVLLTGAWMRDSPERDPDDIKRMLERVWIDATAEQVNGDPLVPVTLTEWVKRAQFDGDDHLVCLATVRDEHVIGLQQAYLDLFIAPKASAAALVLNQRADQPTSAVMVTIPGGTGIIMPVVRGVTHGLLNGIDKLPGVRLAARP